MNGSVSLSDTNLTHTEKFWLHNKHNNKHSHNNKHKNNNTTHAVNDDRSTEKMQQR